MSMQCWCYHCAGCLVTRKTFISHGRMDKPIIAQPAQEHVIAMDSMPPVGNEPDSDESSDYSSSDSDSDEEMDGNALGLGMEADAEGPAVGPAGLSVKEVVLLMLDWMTSHKSTDSSAKDMWALLGMLLPADADLPTFTRVKKILIKAEATYSQRIDICPNDCIAYWDSKHLPMPYRHAHRTECPICGSSRLLQDPADGSWKPAKTVFFFPVEHYLRSLFTRPDLIPFLLADGQHVSESHVTHSRGWREKMVDNPVMSADHRNQGLISTTDGVPFFEDQRRGGWPFVLRSANLPDSLSNHMTNCHLHLLAPSEFWEVDPEANVLRRRIRAPKSLNPHLQIIADDLLGVYSHGTKVADATALNAPLTFTCRACLLFWTGDYPAQAAVSGTHR